jgi:diamine N-acetyltransferase
MTGVRLRLAEPGDAVAIAALSVQVFLDTYAAEGVRPDLAREAFFQYSENAFRGRLAEPTRKFVLAESGPGLVGFGEVLCDVRESPVPGLRGSELVRLYVQPQAQGRQVGSVLLKEVESIALAAGASHLWLSAWEHNARALAFYARKGYAEAGSTTYTFEDRDYGNKLLAKAIGQG